MSLYEYAASSPASVIDPLGLDGCNLQAAFFDAVSQALAARIAAAVGKKIVTVAARSVLLAAVDGPLPIGDVIAAVWGAYDAYQNLRAVTSLKGVYDHVLNVLRDKLSDLWNNPQLADCLNRNGKCCQKAKDLIKTSIGSFGGFTAKSNMGFYKALGKQRKNIEDKLLEIAECCVPKTGSTLKCYRVSTEGFNGPRGNYYAPFDLSKLNDANRRYGMPDRSSSPDRLSSGSVSRGKVDIRGARASDDDPKGRPGGWPEYYVADPNDVTGITTVPIVP
jgi:hypothetical protein